MGVFLARSNCAAPRQQIYLLENTHQEKMQPWGIVLYLAQTQMTKTLKLKLCIARHKQTYHCTANGGSKILHW